MIAFRIPDMTCGHCASTIARAVAGVDKAARIEVDIQRKQVSIDSAATETELTEAIQDAGYRAEGLGGRPMPAVRASGCCCG